MHRVCPHCSTQVKIDPNQLPPEGGCIYCGHCARIMFVDPNETGPTPSLWVLQGDPALRREEVIDGLQLCEDAYAVRWVNEDQGDDLAMKMKQRHVTPPMLIVFGDMHVLLEDPVLLHLGTNPNVVRILVSTHMNDELLEEATAICTVDGYLALPVQPSDVKETIDAGASQLA